MVVAQIEVLTPIILAAWDSFVAPALGGVGLTPAPLRETLVNALPIVAGAFGGGGFGIWPWF